MLAQPTGAPAPNASAARRREQQANDQRQDGQRRENRDFVQVYKLGWQRLQALMASNPQAARLYALLAEHIDGTGAVVATRDVLAEMLGVSTKTISRHAKALEDVRALVRVPLQGGVYAYCLNPEEVWRAYDSGKPHAAFHTKTLVSTRDKSAGVVKRRLRVLLNEREGQAELPLGDDEQ